MAFVPGYQYDIFVSYAHVDDQPFPGQDAGWVTTLVSVLKRRLAQQLGRADAYSLWMDYELSGNVQVTPEILHVLAQCATLLVILSPGYLASEWCGRENENFLRLVTSRMHTGSRIFLIELDKIELTERPLALQDLKGYPFWVVDRDGEPPRILGEPELDQSYYTQLNKLCFELTAELKRLRAAAAQAAPDTPSTEARPLVFLAQVTDDLEDQRDAVKQHLDQAGLRVLPDTMLYPNMPTAFREAVDNDLSQCVLFVQLLSHVIGKRPPGLPQGYARLQYERAVRTGKPILQWRSRELPLPSVTDRDYRAFLQGETVLAVGIEEFKQEIVARARPTPPAPLPSATPHDILVFVNAEPSDSSLAEAVCAVLDRYGIGYALPLAGGTASEVYEDLEQNLLLCTALILIYGSITPKWVREQCNYCRKIIPRRQQSLPIAVYEGPPAEGKLPLGLKLPGMRTLNCRQGVNEAELQTFLHTLEAGNNA